MRIGPRTGWRRAARPIDCKEDDMRKLLSALVVMGLALPVAASAETWSNVTLIDEGCGSKKFASNPADHPTECLKKCAKKGELAVMTSNGKLLKLDKKGNVQAQKAIANVKAEKDVRVNVTGAKQGDTIKVKSLELASS
jgi:hypothetical protein